MLYRGNASTIIKTEDEAAQARLPRSIKSKKINKVEKNNGFYMIKSLDNINEWNVISFMQLDIYLRKALS